MKPKTSSIHLYIKPDPTKTFAELEFKWLAPKELKEYQRMGFKRIKKAKRGKDYV